MGVTFLISPESALRALSDALRERQVDVVDSQREPIGYRITKGKLQLVLSTVREAEGTYFVRIRPIFTWNPFRFRSLQDLNHLVIQALLDRGAKWEDADPPQDGSGTNQGLR